MWYANCRIIYYIYKSVSYVDSTVDTSSASIQLLRYSNILRQVIDDLRAPLLTKFYSFSQHNDTY